MNSAERELHSYLFWCVSATHLEELPYATYYTSSQVPVLIKRWKDFSEFLIL
jgi:hypothetical protein